MDALDPDRRNFAVAFDEAMQSSREGGIPIGAALFRDTELLGSGHNMRVQRSSNVLHGETACLENAGPLDSYEGTTLYTTLSPCAMCSGAILLFQIKRVVIGESRTFVGEEELLRSRGVELVHLDDEPAYRLMQDFVESNPALWSQDIGGR